MTTKEINQSIQSMKIYLTKGERIEHWINFIFLLFPLGFISFLTLSAAIHDKEFPKFTIVLIGMIIMFLRHKIISPKLEVYKADLTEEQFKEANKAAAKLNEWIVLSNKKDYFSAIKETIWQLEGIKITAIQQNGKLYINSMVNPSTRSNPFTFGLNKKNKMELVRQYQSVLKGNNVNEIANKEIEKREDEFWKESEWTAKKILKRIIGYGLSIPFIFLGIWMITLLELKSIFIGIALIGLSSLYIYDDIKILREKKKKKEARL